MKAKIAAPLAFVTGAVAGAATGVLLAPEKGKTTRKNITKTFDAGKDKVEKTVDKLTGSAKDVTKDVKEKTDSKVAEAKKAVS